MNHLTIGDAIHACKGKLIGTGISLDTEISDVIIDSRKVTKDSLFVALDGERINAHRFIPNVMEGGALCVVSQEILENPSFPYILVDSTDQALLDIAKFYRDSFENLKVIGITGSVGKTSSKEMIASVLSEKYKVHKTQGNFNNAVGLPLSIFRLSSDDEISVLEMGVNHFGEMKLLSTTATPDICVFTNIGSAHLEFFKTKEGIFKEKTTMLEDIRPGGSIIVNGDDKLLKCVAPTKGIVPTLYGTSPTFDTYADNVESLGLRGTNCDIHLRDGCSFRCHVPVPGFHMVLNALAAASVGQALSLSCSEIRRGIEKFTSSSGRNHIVDTNKIIILDDCYNANPVSMKAAIDVLSLGIGRKVAILGDMGELGDNCEELHREVGKYAADAGINLVVSIGELSKAIKMGSSNNNPRVESLWFDTKEEFINKMTDIIEEGDNVLVKASHGMDLPAVVSALEKLY
ncbi:MAG: UDP-N-acetylmuramoyl-tripeptide--D-alanyl-D-alanine ligase [Suipraeoptans sp.]